eukprot:5287116-Prymnesium_polylepis.2
MPNCCSAVTEPSRNRAEEPRLEFQRHATPSKYVLTLARIDPRVAPAPSDGSSPISPARTALAQLLEFVHGAPRPLQRPHKLLEGERQQVAIAVAHTRRCRNVARLALLPCGEDGPLAEEVGVLQHPHLEALLLVLEILPNVHRAALDDEECVVGNSLPEELLPRHTDHRLQLVQQVEHGLHLQLVHIEDGALLDEPSVQMQVGLSEQLMGHPGQVRRRQGLLEG